MALPMVHLAVAHEFARRKGELLADGSYYLGAIAPDAVHMRKNYERQHKAASHFTLNKSREADLKVWIADALANYDATSHDSFSLGYVIHVLTDVLWTDGEGGMIFDSYAQDPAPVQKQMEAYYNDTDVIDLLLYHKEPWRKDVFGAMEHAAAAAFGELVTMEECDAWRKRTIRWYSEHEISSYQPLRYTSLEKVRSFIQRAAEQLADIL